MHCTGKAERAAENAQPAAAGAAVSKVALPPPGIGLIHCERRRQSPVGHASQAARKRSHWNASRDGKEHRRIAIGVRCDRDGLLRLAVVQWREQHGRADEIAGLQHARLAGQHWLRGPRDRGGGWRACCAEQPRQQRQRRQLLHDQRHAPAAVYAVTTIIMK
jgi:hypothetical protein